MTHDDLHGIRFGYLRRVLSERWPVPSRVPAMLAVSRDSSVVAADFARLGFRVEGIRPRDASLESLSRRLADRAADFDIVCCWDVLEQGDDWQGIVGVMARALRSGGVFFYSVTDELISPRDLHATLRRHGLFPQRVVALDHGVSLGYAFRRSDRPASLTDGCWRFRTTLEQWVYVPAEQEQGGNFNRRSASPPHGPAAPEDPTDDRTIRLPCAGSAHRVGRPPGDGPGPV